MALCLQWARLDPDRAKSFEHTGLLARWQDHSSAQAACSLVSILPASHWEGPHQAAGGKLTWPESACGLCPTRGRKGRSRVAHVQDSLAASTPPPVLPMGRRPSQQP